MAPSSSIYNLQLPRRKSSPDFTIKVMSQTPVGLPLYGADYCYWFLEIGSGSAILTQAVRFVGPTAMSPVDLVSGYDLTTNACYRKLRDIIAKSRPLYTHFAPCCRIFS